MEDNNHLNCVFSKVNIAKVLLKIVLENEKRYLPQCNLYYDMKYELPHLTFSNAYNDNDASSTIR